MLDNEKIEAIKAKMAKGKADADKNRIEYWKNLNKKFKDLLDIPRLNIFGEDHAKYVVPALIRCGAIPKDELENGVYYYGKHRAGKVGRWMKDENQFRLVRYKWGNYRTEDYNHFEDDDGYDLFVPIRKANEEEIKDFVKREK